MFRIKELDYLRGLAALSIMCYHFMKWLHVYDGAHTFIGRLSVYGVEMFYILSGIALFHVYNSNLNLKKVSIVNYFTKRFFRIFPLFWLSIALTLIVALKKISVAKLLLNVSGIFSVFSWDEYIATGSWSIGNELVFYFFFPFLIFLLNKSRIYFSLVGALFMLIYHYFAFYIFNPNDSLHNQWTNFVNPLNHLFLFYVGLIIPMLFKQKIANTTAVLVILIGAIMLFCFPSGKDGIHLLYGIKRWIFTIGTILICTGFYKIELALPKLLDCALQQLGEISFGVYLLHPIVYQLLCILIRKLQPYYIFPNDNTLLIMLGITLTLVISKLVHKYFELYFMKIGAKVIANSYKS
jgi:peptidoglycan/LPS O-acetylase OafA/YrhL